MQYSITEIQAEIEISRLITRYKNYRKKKENISIDDRRTDRRTDGQTSRTTTIGSFLKKEKPTKNLIESKLG